MKILNDNLSEVIQSYRRQNKKIVFTNGCFDLLHIGHIRYLEEAAALGDVLIVGINSDSSVKKIKGPTRPIQNENDRAEILASLKAVDHTVIFTEDTPYNLISRVLPDILVKGGDWTIDQIVGSDLVLANNGQVKSLLFIDGKSTSKIIEKSKT
ncbi:MAG: D-glycero-beta-D-manno-heptose 1-phosphate adenylyltransferase [Moraxellaceae bacterium]|nr:D-glycero-beta-D-manno-heptose 1-phosphate adenylyltransferase [Pseudobdellovibrionaceae bacterium]